MVITQDESMAVGRVLEGMHQEPLAELIAKEIRAAVAAEREAWRKRLADARLGETNVHPGYCADAVRRMLDGTPNVSPVASPEQTKQYAQEMDPAFAKLLKEEAELSDYLLKNAEAMEEDNRYSILAAHKTRLERVRAEILAYRPTRP